MRGRRTSAPRGGKKATDQNNLWSLTAFGGERSRLFYSICEKGPFCVFLQKKNQPTTMPRKKKPPDKAPPSESQNQGLSKEEWIQKGEFVKH